MIKFEGKQITKIPAKYLIIGSVSANQTPSRALDILIASNKFNRIGFLQSKHIEPAVGYPIKAIGLSLGLPAEVYQRDDVVIVQLRSNVRIGRKKQFVSQLQNLFTSVFEIDKVLVVGSLPYCIRPDLQIQSLVKNTYYFSKPENQSLKKAESNNLIKSLSLLVDRDQETTDILGDGGIIKQILKSEKLRSIDYLCVFSESLIDHEAAYKLAKSISQISENKSLGVIEQNILSQ